MFNKSKKGLLGFNALEGIILTLVISGITLAMGLYAMTQVSNNVTGTANTSITAVITAIGAISNWYAILVAVAMIAIVISVLMILRTPGSDVR